MGPGIGWVRDRPGAGAGVEDCRGGGTIKRRIMTIGRPPFASDNWPGIHPDVLAAIIAANAGHAPAYGADPVTAEAVRLFRQHFGEGAEVFFTFNGTGANVVGLQSIDRKSTRLNSSHL